MIKIILDIVHTVIHDSILIFYIKFVGLHQHYFARIVQVCNVDDTSYKRCDQISLFTVFTYIVVWCLWSKQSNCIISLQEYNNSGLAFPTKILPAAAIDSAAVVSRTFCSIQPITWMTLCMTPTWYKTDMMEDTKTTTGMALKIKNKCA